MKPSSEVGVASGEETGMGETMEGVVTTVDVITSVVEAVEAMMTAVEMLEGLEVGRTETERTTAARFFSRTLACPVNPDDSLISFLPLYWPGHLPRLVPLLSDCLLPHNSKSIQSDAILSLKHLGDAATFLLQESDHISFTSLPVYALFFKSYAWKPLISLANESDCLEIRNQAFKAIGSIAKHFPPDDHKVLCVFGRHCLPLTSALVRKYAAILEPTEMEMSGLNISMEVLIKHCEKHLDDVDLGHISDILPVIISIFQEPGNRKEAQFQAALCLRTLSCSSYEQGRTLLIDHGVLTMVLETLRVGKESAGVRLQILMALSGFLASQVTVESALNLGVMHALHQTLKRPKVVDSLNSFPATWYHAVRILSRLSEGTPAHQKAILSEEGLMERVLELGMELKLENTTETTKWHHVMTADVMRNMMTLGSESQKRRLMHKSLFFRLLCRYLKAYPFPYLVEESLVTLDACLAVPGSADELRIRRLLVDNSGITDNVRDINCPIAHIIFDTYLKNPAPPPPPNKLPSIIYTKNVP